MLSRVGFACGGKFFQVGNASCVRMCCVRVWGLGVDEARIFCGLSTLLVGGFEQSVFVFWFVLFVWHAVGCLGQHRVVVL